jgi:hypothetical protein
LKIRIEIDTKPLAIWNVQDNTFPLATSTTAQACATGVRGSLNSSCFSLAIKEGKLLNEVLHIHEQSLDLLSYDIHAQTP